MAAPAWHHAERKGPSLEGWTKPSDTSSRDENYRITAPALSERAHAGTHTPADAELHGRALTAPCAQTPPVLLHPPACVHAFVHRHTHTPAPIPTGVRDHGDPNTPVWAGRRLAHAPTHNPMCASAVPDPTQGLSGTARSGKAAETNRVGGTGGAARPW